MGFGSDRFSRVPLLNARLRAARLAWAREHRNCSVEDWKRVAWSNESRFRLLNVYGRRRIWRQAHEVMDPTCQVGSVQGHGGSIMVWDVFRGTFRDLWCVFQPSSMQFGVKGPHTAPTSLTELWIALVNIWQVFSEERFQKLVESMSRHVEVVLRARGRPNSFLEKRSNRRIGRHLGRSDMVVARCWQQWITLYRRGGSGRPRNTKDHEGSCNQKSGHFGTNNVASIPQRHLPPSRHPVPSRETIRRRTEVGLRSRL
ncbi:transposable element Tc1 transposase [Trichonephila clavipes]|nr:transposable element Tc1 transposase [Trichonephila clavipes]